MISVRLIYITLLIRYQSWRQGTKCDWLSVRGNGAQHIKFNNINIFSDINLIYVYVLSYNYINDNMRQKVPIVGRK